MNGLQKCVLYKHTLSLYKNRKIQPGWKCCLILTNGFVTNATTDGLVFERLKYIHCISKLEISETHESHYVRYESHVASLALFFFLECILIILYIHI